MTKCQFVTVLVVCFMPVVSVLAQVTSQEDRYSTTLDTPIILAAPGVLSNDYFEDSLGARLIAGPLHGEGSLLSDGSLLYTPADGFNGTDTLIYVAQALRPIVFTIDSVATNLLIEAELDSDFGSDDDDDDSRAGGTIEAYLLPHAPPFFDLHVTSLDVTFLDRLELDFSVLIASLSADVEAGEMQISMTESGGSASVDNTNFEQPENQFQLNATVEIGGFQESTENVVVNQTSTLSGSIEMNTAGDSLIMQLPLNFTGAFAVSGADVTIDATGTLFATAPYEPAHESEETLVLFDVGTPVSSADGTELPSMTTLYSAYPNPFNPQTTVAYELAADADVRLSLYDVMGREVRTLVEKRQPAGRYDVTLDAGTLPSGMYLLHLRAGLVSQTGRIVLAK